jgi:hypothetical protein
MIAAIAVAAVRAGRRVVDAEDVRETGLISIAVPLTGRPRDERRHRSNVFSTELPTA